MVMDVFVRHLYPVIALVNYGTSLLLTYSIGMTLLRRHRPFAAMLILIVIGESYVLSNIVVMHDVAIFVFALVPVLVPSLVFSRRTMMLLLGIVFAGLGAIMLINPALRSPEQTRNLIPAMAIVVILIGTFMALGSGIRRAMYDFAVLMVEREVEAVARGRAEEANEQLRASAAQTEELATANTRTRIAGQLHDSLGHYLTMLSLHSEAVAADFERNPASALESLQTVRALAKEASAALRQSVTALHAMPSEQQPFVEALKRLATESDTTGVRTVLAVLGEPRLLPAQVNSTVYSALQECLTNVHKHAHATQVELTLDYRGPTLLRLLVHDNGCGAPGSSEGHGLRLMRERVAALGGTLDISTDAGQGFTLTMEVPS